MKRSIRGNIPPEKDGWVEVGKLPGGKIKGTRWRVFFRGQNKSKEWILIKVVADGRAEGKANYWLSWNGERFAFLQDYKKMGIECPILMKEVKTFFLTSKRIRKLWDEI